MINKKILPLTELKLFIIDEIDFENEENLIEDELLDSFDIISIVAAIDDEFDVKITAKDIVPENFNSAEALYELIQRLEEE